MTILTASEAFNKQIRELCLKEFPCSMGTWVSYILIYTFCDYNNIYYAIISIFNIK